VRRRLLIAAGVLLVAVAVVVGGAYLVSEPSHGVRTGSRAPDIQVHVLQGGHPTGIPLLGRSPILLVFFDNRYAQSAGWLGAANALHKRFALDGLAVIGVDTYESAPDAVSFVEHLDVQFMILHDPAGAASREAYGGTLEPRAYLIDSSGTVVRIFDEIGDLARPETREDLARLLQRPPSAAPPR
jgi:peroxiredoxin